MKKVVLTYGLISGAITSVLMAIWTGNNMDMDTGEIVGYTSIILSLSLVFFGIRSYREKLNGQITFGKAFKVGVLIALISSTCYVITWVIIYYNFVPDFMERYSTHVIEKMKTKGASAHEMEEQMAKMQVYKEMYKNPLMVVALTFLECFPIGLLVALISALILKKKSAPPAMA